MRGAWCTSTTPFRLSTGSEEASWRMPLVHVGVPRTSISGTGGKFAGQVLARFSVVLFSWALGRRSSPLGRRRPSIRSSSPPADGVEHHRPGGDRARRGGCRATDCAAPVIGSYGVAASLVVTLSFLMTTPHLDPAFSSFIIKNVTLLWRGRSIPPPLPRLLIRRRLRQRRRDVGRE